MRLSKNMFNVPILTDGGLETTLVYHQGIDLPHFAAFDVLNTPKLQKVIVDYYRPYLDLAKKFKTGFILESPTWRANTDWGFKMGYSQKELDQVNDLAVQLLKPLRRAYLDEVNPILISGCIGPREDGYVVGNQMSANEAKAYHGKQIKALKDSGVDLLSAMTMNYCNEALGVVLSAKSQRVPVVISFTTETDGKLPSGESLQASIQRIDRESGNYVLYYMINCAHPEHFAHLFDAPAKWQERISGIRANASCKSHAELDASTELDLGDKKELARWYKDLKEKLPNLKVLGGCCGTDSSHIEHICQTTINAPLGSVSRSH